MKLKACTYEQNIHFIKQTRKSKIFEKFFSKIEKNFLLLHYGEKSNILLSHREEVKTYLKAASKARIWRTKIDCYLEAIPLLIRNGAFEKALDVFENAIWETRRNNYAAEKETCYLIAKKMKPLQKELFMKGSYEFIGDALTIEAKAITHFEPEKAAKLAEFAKKCVFLENQRWKILKMILLAVGEEGRKLIDFVRFTGDFAYIIDYMKKFENHPEQEKIKAIIARAQSLQTLKDEIEDIIFDVEVK